MFKYSYYLFALLGTVNTVVITQCNIVYAISATDVGTIAEAITVLINTPGSPGSGVIVAQDGDTYTVLTAKHVVNSINAGEEAYVTTNDGNRYSVNTYRIRKYKDVDLAVLEFKSLKQYKVAKLGDSAKVAIGSLVYVAGFPLPTVAMNRSTFNLTSGKITAKETDTYKDGYGLVYDNPTISGMSGGAVLNEAGELIGIHGRADTESTKPTDNPNIALKTGFNLAIPINTYIKSDSGDLFNNDVFSNLNKDLEEQNFWQADLETKRIILRYFNLNEKEYLVEDNIKKLPCQLLATIDKKWLRSSQAKFGFSTQKLIWQGDYEEFASKVGWLYRGTWKPPTRETYNLNAPKGYLPRQFLDGPIWHSFIDKVKECNL